LQFVLKIKTEKIVFKYALSRRNISVDVRKV
jgi:hypothetical protein